MSRATKKVDHSFTTKIGLKLGFSTIRSGIIVLFIYIGPFCINFIFKIPFVGVRPRDLSNVVFDIPSRIW